MFYNALVRKGKLDPETKEEDMTSVVAIHNCMNEGTWKRILQWEKVLSGGG
jgi:cytochrome c heme-lyase